MAMRIQDLGRRDGPGTAGGTGRAELVSGLFHAGTVEEVARRAVQFAQARFECRNVRLAWTTVAIAGEHARRDYWPETPLSPGDSTLVDTALAQLRDAHAEGEPTGWVRIATPLAGARAALVADWPLGDDAEVEQPAEWHEFTTLVGGALQLAWQRIAIERMEKTSRLQNALYAIADLASGELDMPEMLHRVHRIVAELMYAENFYIALYNGEHDSLRFIYFADEKDKRPADPDREFPAAEICNSLTLAVIRHGRPAMGPPVRLRKAFGLKTDIDTYGPDSADWLGVPMVAGSEVRGAVVVQCYDHPGRYDEEDRVLLAFVAQHILTALVRKQAHDELERRVDERTHELIAQVHERQRGERLQAALYSIADLASSELDMGEMLRRIHGAVGELMYAKNFYIALFDSEHDTLRFIYHADEKDPGIVDPEAVIPAGQLQNSLTLGLIRHGRAAMGNARDVANMLSVPGGIGLGTPAEDFLGVPMVADGELRGVIVVQSYDPSVRYVEEDRALLSYVAQHILTALARKQAQAQLEHHVTDRTRELAEAVRELRDQIAERERAEQRLVHETLHDSLTGLPNRTFLYDALERALARLHRDPDKHFAVLFLDLDRFKVINDSVGHLVGDEMLKEAGERLASCVRPPDVVARLGGDEFALLLDDAQGPEQACHVAQRVIEALSVPMRIAGKELFSSASVGIALSHERYRSAEELLRDADVAMYRAKAHGRQRFEIFDERLHREALHLLDLESDLRRAIQRSEFEPHFQPIVRLDDGHVVGYEALLRWRHPQRGLLAPQDFLRVAEDNGSIEQIDWQMFEKTCREIPLLGGEHHYVTLNVSPRHFRSPALAQQMLAMLDLHHLAPDQVRLEVTEGALLDNPDQVLATLDTLRDAGVLAALDDFGTGYSSLSYLHRFPLHALKIDRSFISALQLRGTGGSAAVVRAVLALAGTLGLEVIAEGIETSEQHDHLLEMGCEQGQGFLFSRARPAAEWAARSLH
jgi:diguanylate cyclase (GGDEF)-like protein